MVDGAPCAGRCPQYVQGGSDLKALELKGLGKTYATGRVALGGIDLSVEDGDFFALLGPNGAGKSTTIGIITSLVRKSTGTVKVYGIDIDEDFEAAKAQLGVVPQEFNFSMFESVLEIVLNQAGFYGLPRQQALVHAEDCLRQVELWDNRHERSRNLSGGMKRRLMIARALVHQPRLLILDEPTAGVDIEVRRLMWDFLSELNRRGTTVILTTHYLEEAERLCRNIAIIDHGQIVENTTMKELLAKLRAETFVLDLKTVGIHEPPYSWLLRGVKKAPGQRLEINVATLLTNISTEFIAAINGKRTLKLPYITFGLIVFDFLFYMLGLDPTFFSDGSCAPAQTSSQFTAVEFTRHLRKLGCDWEKEVHHDLLPYRGCDEKTKAFVRFIC
jgi:ABC-2 type transport system ATP-binding protein